jgi:hypothetical protein
MAQVKKLILDVLKPHQPNALEFCQRIATDAPNCRVRVTVEEVDEKTDTLKVVIEGRDIDFESVQQAITDMGASLHSIDEVEVESDTTSD